MSDAHSSDRISPTLWYDLTIASDLDDLAREMADLNRRTAAYTAIRRITAMVTAEDYEGDTFALQQQQQTLQTHYDRCMAAHDGLLATAGEGALDAHNILWNEVEDHYNLAMAKLYRMQATARPEVQDDAASSVARNHNGESRLPPLQIPKFDGSLESWIEFRDAFYSAIHSADLSDIYKLAKLREAVRGDAARLVGGTYTGGYQEVWDALNSRYDHPRHLTTIQINRLVNMKSAPNESKSTLMAFVDTVNSVLRALRFLQLPVDHWDVIIIDIILPKLPLLAQQAWNMGLTSNTHSTLVAFLKFVERRAHTLPSSGTTASTSDSRATVSNLRRRTPATNTSAASQNQRLVKSNLAATAPGSCSFCNDKSHYIGRCPQLMELSVANRFSRLQGSNLCFNCLKPGHATKQCASGNCRTCNGKHHTLLCRNGNTDRTTNTTSEAAPSTTSTSDAAPTNHPGPSRAN